MSGNLTLRADLLLGRLLTILGPAEDAAAGQWHVRERKQLAQQGHC